ncbi:MAG TPA: type II toxin-antitoxin system VapC family toxin [Abditibacterium sp.]|jgi:tRNA(fMet)-specific endonuclease VapC
MRVLLDTDILSALMRSDPVATEAARNYNAIYSQLSISIITRYEILRGLKAKRAEVQAARFEIFCAHLQILPLTDAVVMRAAEIYARLHQSGNLIGDADILIAATAMESGFALSTNNANHLARIEGLTLENWLQT